MKLILRTLSGTAAIALLAGCSGGIAQPLADGGSGSGAVSAASSATGSVSPKTSSLKPFVNVAGITSPFGNHTFVSSAGTATVSIWGENGELNGILFDGIDANPTGLTTDAAQSLYVVNTNISNVIEYAKPYTSITATLDDAGETPEDVAVDAKGVVGVTNYLTTSFAPGSVSFFAKGATQPCKIVHDPNWTYFINDAFDAAGNLFIDGQTSTGRALVGEVSGGCNATGVTTLSVGNTITTPGGVQVNRGNILIGDVAKLAIYTYAAPSNGTLGMPTAVTTLAGAQEPITFAIERKGNHVRTADLSPNTEYAALYTYPGGAYKSKLADHVFAIGVAVYPPAMP